MHEVSVMQSALDIAFDHAKKQGAEKIHRIGLKVGALSGVVPDALEFAFSVLKENTIASTATFEPEYSPAIYKCKDCEHEFQTENYAFECPQCKSSNNELISGNELHLTFIEVT